MLGDHAAGLEVDRIGTHVSLTMTAPLPLP
jgi:hypothetical protein